MSNTTNTLQRARLTDVGSRSREPEPLLPRVARGDARAVDECLARYNGLVWSLARRLVRSRNETEDAVQEVFVEIWKKASRFDNTLSNEMTFVVLLARRRLIDRRRIRHPSVHTVAIDWAALPPLFDHDQELVDIEDEAEQATRVLTRLRPAEQRVLHLSIFEGMSHEAISRATALPLGTVKTHLRRGLARARELLSVQSAG